MAKPQTASPGIHLGNQLYWEPHKNPNPHMVILGTSGSGKSQIAWEMLHNLPEGADYVAEGGGGATGLAG
jgi:hypothetical protein